MGRESVGLVVKPIFNQILAAAVLFLVGFIPRIAPASVKGNPNAAPGYSAFRRFVSLFVIAFAIVIEIKFLLTELGYLGIISGMQTSAAIITLSIVLLVIVLFVAFFRMVRKKEPSGNVLDDDNKWFLGIFYFNPSDSSLFVEKRSGIGRTVNFGRPLAWVLIAALILFIIIRSFWSK